MCILFYLLVFCSFFHIPMFSLIDTNPLLQTPQLASEVFDRGNCQRAQTLKSLLQACSHPKCSRCILKEYLTRGTYRLYNTIVNEDSKSNETLLMLLHCNDYEWFDVLLSDRQSHNMIHNCVASVVKCFNKKVFE